MPSTLAGWAQVETGLFDFARKGSLGSLLPGGATNLRAPDDWRPWLTALFPHYFGSFAPHHEEYWRWLWSVEPDKRPQPFVGIWSRGHGKSTSAEAGVAALGLRGIRRYALYVCATQDAADKRVTTIGSLLEGAAVGAYYPEHADRAVNRYGHSRGWRRDRLATSGGFVVDAAGLDTAIRGLKFEEHRPDFIVLDDLDGKHDSPHATQKKIETITHSILPASAPGAVVLAVQNLIIPNGIFSRLADGRADFLADRIVSGPHPAIKDLETRTETEDDGRRRTVVVGGVPSWQDRDLEWAQEEINKDGFTAFNQECQHQVHEREGALWSKALLNETRRSDGFPRLVRIVVAADPSGGGDDIGIVIAGLGADGHGYVIEDRSQEGSRGPLNWGRECVQGYLDHQADRIVGEKNYGGDMVESNIRVAASKLGVEHVSYRHVTASRGKQVRAEPVAALFEEGRAHLCGHFPELEAELTGWVPGESSDSPNRLDALVWALTELMLTNSRPPSGAVVKWS